MKQIPKIIHQVWSGVNEPLPKHFLALGETWKRDYPDWEYIGWNNEKMNSFVQTYYPQHWEVYEKYPYNVQRWDAIRYLILDKMGGMYMDYDYESIRPLDEIIKNKKCCFALEPHSHCALFKKRVMFNNALMASIPGHFFIKKIIETVFSPKMLEYDITPQTIIHLDAKGNKILEYKTFPKNDCVLNTTGPFILMNLYNALQEEEKKEIYLIPAKYVSPFDGYQAGLAMAGDQGEDLEDALQEAYAVHYYLSNWRKDNK